MLEFGIYLLVQANANSPLYRTKPRRRRRIQDRRPVPQRPRQLRARGSRMGEALRREEVDAFALALGWPPSVSLPESEMQMESYYIRPDHASLS